MFQKKFFFKKSKNKIILIMSQHKILVTRQNKNKRQINKIHFCYLVFMSRYPKTRAVVWVWRHLTEFSWMARMIEYAYHDSVSFYYNFLFLSKQVDLRDEVINFLLAITEKLHVSNTFWVMSFTHHPFVFCGPNLRKVLNYHPFLFCSPNLRKVLN